MVHQQNCL